MSKKRPTPGELLLDVPIAKMISDAGQALAEAQAALDSGSIKLALALAQTRIASTDGEGVLMERSLIELGFMPTFYHVESATFTFNLSASVRFEEGFAIGINATVASDKDSMDGAGEKASATLPNLIDNKPKDEPPGEAVPPPANTDTGPETLAEGAEEVQPPEGQPEQGEPEDNGSSDDNGGALSTDGETTPQAGESAGRSVLFGASLNMDYHNKYGYSASGSTSVSVNFKAVPAPLAFQDYVRSLHGAPKVTTPST